MPLFSVLNYYILTIKINNIRFCLNSWNKVETLQEEKSGFRKFLRKRIVEISSDLSSKNLKGGDKERLEAELEKIVLMLEDITNLD